MPHIQALRAAHQSARSDHEETAMQADRATAAAAVTLRQLPAPAEPGAAVANAAVALVDLNYEETPAPEEHL